MPFDSRHELTGLLQDWSEGDKTAFEKLAPLVYGELKRLARKRMAKEGSPHTLESGALVNEAFLRLVDWKSVHWQNRAHFFAVSAQMMRRILVDYARSRGYAKRGGGQRPLPLHDTAILSRNRAREFVALDEALARLDKIDSRKSKVVELRFFGGLSVDEIASVLQVSEVTVRRDWQFARSWLEQELSQADYDGG
jgi:RNA polymerase sigma-70 factor, ECF subfamily